MLIFFVVVIEFNLITMILGNTKGFRMTWIALLAALVLLYHKKSSRSFHHCHILEFPFSFSASLHFSTEFELLTACYSEESRRRSTLLFGVSLVPFSSFICMCGSCFLLIYWKSVSPHCCLSWQHHAFY